MTRPDQRCEHMDEDPNQCSMYYIGEVYCLPCIVAIHRQNGDNALLAGVLLERNIGKDNFVRSYPRLTA